jgi:molybdopterin converting factor small subunit
MKVKLLAFGIAKEILGKKAQDYDFEGADVGDFRTEMQKKYPPLARLQNFAIAVNLAYAADNLQIKENDEVAIIPPVSGG